MNDINKCPVCGCSGCFQGICFQGICKDKILRKYEKSIMAEYETN